MGDEDARLNTRINNQKAAREEGDEKLTTAVEANDADILALQNKDTKHGKVHKALQDEDTRLNTRINNQKAAREEGDKTLTTAVKANDADILALQNKDTELNTRINNQKAAREKGDKTLTTAVEANDADISALSTSIEAEKVARKRADDRVKNQVAALTKATVVQNAQLQQKIKNARNSIAKLSTKMGNMKSDLLAKADAIVQQMETRADAIAIEVTKNTDSIADLKDKVDANKDEVTTKMQEETAAVNAEFARVIALIDEAKLDDFENHKKAVALVDSLQVVLEGKLDASEANTSSALKAAETRLAWRLAPSSRIRSSRCSSMWRKRDKTHLPRRGNGRRPSWTRRRALQPWKQPSKLRRRPTTRPTTRPPNKRSKKQRNSSPQRSKPPTTRRMKSLTRIGPVCRLSSMP